MNVMPSLPSLVETLGDLGIALPPGRLRADGYGDSAELSESLLQLIRSGRKRAGTGLLWAYEHDGEDIARTGDVEIVIDHRNQPALVTRITGAEVVPYGEVTAEYAAIEGEGDGSLEYWRDAHWAFFSRECARIGRQPDESMPVVCSIFEVLHVIPPVAFKKLPLRTERLILRPLRQDDAAALFSIHADPEVMRYWSTPPWTDVQQATDMIDRETKALASGEHLRLAIQHRRSGALVGACTLFSFNESSRRAEVGYILGAENWGQGLMTEALERLISYAFEDLTLNRIEADIDPRNAASEKILQRLGFKKEGHLRERWIVAGEVSDTALYGLLRSDWSGRT